MHWKPWTPRVSHLHVTIEDYDRIEDEDEYWKWPYLQHVVVWSFNFSGHMGPTKPTSFYFIFPCALWREKENQPSLPPLSPGQEAGPILKYPTQS